MVAKNLVKYILLFIFVFLLLDNILKSFIKNIKKIIIINKLDNVVKYVNVFKLVLVCNIPYIDVISII